ncbi:MAG: hypothetical protein J0L99_21585 [Chitinophagales bacterium]|nr:hypothetical protein [Chitinophagales bacterium]
MQAANQQPLSNVQLELLKTFSHNLNEQDLLALRKVLANFFAERLIAQADQAWEQNNWTDATVEELLHTKLRKRK